MSEKPWVDIFSGLDAKGPAAILLSFGGKTFLLDAGDGPEEGVLLDVARLPPLDGVILSHNHEDHIKALSRWNPDCPIYATDYVARYLPSSISHVTLPYQGEFDLFGVTLTTGRTGHAPGGVWLHFGLAGGVLYTGDFSMEANSIPFDMPPQSRVLLADSSYGSYDRPLEECKAIFLAMVEEARQTLLPLPLSGRAGDILLLLDEHFADEWSLEPELLNDLEKQATLLDDERLAGICRKAAPFNPAARVMLTSDPHLSKGVGMKIAQDWLREGVEHRQIIFTGHVIKAVAPYLESGVARFCRWNVHPRFSHLKELAIRCRAERLTPLFTPLDNVDFGTALSHLISIEKRFEL